MTERLPDVNPELDLTLPLAELISEAYADRIELVHISPYDRLLPVPRSFPAVGLRSAQPPLYDPVTGQVKQRVQIAVWSTPSTPLELDWDLLRQGRFYNQPSGQIHRLFPDETVVVDRRDGLGLRLIKAKVIGKPRPDLSGAA